MLGALGASLIQGGASLVSGLLSPKKSQSGAQKSIAKSNIKRVIVKNKQEEAWNKQVQARADKAAKVPIVTKTTEQSSVDVKGMMAAAEKAGFNPVTWLQAGGMQAYARSSSTQTVTGSTAMEAALVGLEKPEYAFYQRETGAPQASGMTVGEAIGSALQAGANTYLAQRQQIDQNNFQRQLAMDELVARNAAAGSAGGRVSGLGSAPRVSATGYTTGGNGGYLTPSGSNLKPTPQIYTPVDSGGIGIGGPAGTIYSPYEIDTSENSPWKKLPFGEGTEQVVKGVEMINDPRNKDPMISAYDKAKKAVGTIASYWWDEEIGKYFTVGGGPGGITIGAPVWPSQKMDRTIPIRPTLKNSRIMQREANPNW